MRKSILIFILLFTGFLGVGQKNDVSSLLVPQPVSVTSGTGYFLINNKTNIQIVTADTAAVWVANFLSGKLSLVTTYPLQVINHSKKQNNNTISLILKDDASLGNEGYKLSVNTKGVSLSANKPAGLFYAVQTLFQLLPNQVESKQPVKNVKWQVPVCSISDVPRFGWRGLMFDVSRHFFTKDEVKSFIDEMVKYKFNILHLHLTDDEGWRIEIKGLPRLTEVGAWNVKKVGGNFADFSPPLPDEPRNYGGFYTQNDIRELVQYAQERFVNILPEIDVPGHSLAAIASYPELSCTPGAETYRVGSGERILTWENNVPTALVDNTLCPANEKVYVFLDTIMSQIAKLFPFEYIHVGGDECARNFWKKSSAVKALMQKEGLKNMDEVQFYFEKRLEKIVLSKNRKMLAWEPGYDDAMPSGATLMRWYRLKPGMHIPVIKQPVVMCPADFTYFCFMQGDPAIEPYLYATVTLKKAYQFDPSPPEIDPKYVLGGQADLWTEQIYNMRHAEYMLWPRAMATAEAVWSPKEKRNWDDFSQRVEKQFKRFDAAQIKYAPSIYDPTFDAEKTSTGQLKIELSTEIKGLDIHYSFDNSFPDQFYPKYTTPLIAPKDAEMLRVITYRDNKPIGRMISISIEELQKRADRKIK
jgi:hexosaminidase